MTERELDRDKRRVLEHLKEARKFMPYLHEGRSAGSVVKLLGSRDRAWRALVALVQDREIEYETHCSPDYFRAFAKVEPAPVPVDAADPWEEQVETPITDTIRQAMTGGEQIKRVRATLAPRPELHYPVPWRVAEKNPHDHAIVECADGSYTAECPTREAAEAIVLAVNTFAGVA